MYGIQTYYEQDIQAPGLCGPFGPNMACGIPTALSHVYKHAAVGGRTGSHPAGPGAFPDDVEAELSCLVHVSCFFVVSHHD